MFLEPDGSVVDYFDQRLDASTVMLRLGDQPTYTEFVKIRRMQKAIWGGSIATGAVIAGFGCLTFLTGLGVAYVTPEHDLTMANSGLAMAGVGFAGVAIGVAGTVASGTARNDPRTWYADDVLVVRLTIHERELRAALRLDE